MQMRSMGWGVAAALLVMAGPARGALLPPDLTAKLDPRLVELVTAGASDPEPVWVEFRDKGEEGPEALARMLGEARASLAPRALRRRVRAHVEPLVDYGDLPVHAPYLAALAAQGFTPYGASRWLNRVAVRAEPTRFAGLAALPFVTRLEPVERAVRTPDVTGGAPAGLTPAREARGTRIAISYGLTAPGLNQIDLPALHNLGFTGAGVLICILDDGFNYYERHEALKDQVIQPGRVRDFVDGDWTVQDTLATGIALNHGSWTFGTVGGYKPGTFVGAAYGAEFALGRTENDYSEHLVEMVYWGMGAEWADSMGADLISSSLGYNTFDDPDPSYTYADMDGHTTIISRAAEIAASKGLLVVTAAGNEGGSPWQHIVAPADVNGDSLIAVGAVNLSGVRASFSSIGPTADGRIKPDLVALGVSNPLPRVSFPFDPTAYITGSGTSFSTPLVAGLAACLMQAHPAATPEQIISALRMTASQAGSPDNYRGYGIPDAMAAHNLLAPVSVTGGSLRIELAGPNPLRPGQSAVLRLSRLSAGIPQSRQGAVDVLDAQGRRVRHLWSGDPSTVPATTVLWDGRDDDGNYVRPGLYFATLEAAKRTSAARVVFLR